MRRIELKNKSVLITGAGRGLGKQLALYLAGVEGAKPVLVGRHRESLLDVASEIDELCNVEVKTIVQDLLADNAAKILFDKVRNERIFGLINNAGMTFYGRTEASRIEFFRSIIELDFKVVVELCLLFLSRFQASGEGFILNITSLASFVPIPFQSIYAAAKSATQNFSECLVQENKGSPVLISTFAPAGISTEMIEESGLAWHMKKYLSFYITPERAAEVAVKALKRGRHLILPGKLSKIIYFFINFLPRGILLMICNRIYGYEEYRVDDKRKI